MLHHHDEGFDSYQIMTLEEAIKKLKQCVETNGCALNQDIYYDEFDELVLKGVISKEEEKKHEYEIIKYMAQKILRDLNVRENVENGYTVYYEGSEFIAVVKIQDNEGTRY